MGGHGGLNILPQKKWNVYNRDNQEKVQRDKRKVHEKRNQEEDSKLKDESHTLVSELRLEKERRRHDENDTSKYAWRLKTESSKKHELFFKKQADEAASPTQIKAKGVNLFQEEEEMEKAALQQKLDIKSGKFFEGKPFEQDNLFGGNYKNQPAVPWYLKQNKKIETEPNHLQQQIKDYRSHKSSTKSFYKLINIDKQKDNQKNQRSRSRSPKLKEKQHKESRSQQEENNSKYDKHKKVESNINKKIKMEKLRAEKYLREEQEKERIRNLILENK